METFIKKLNKESDKNLKIYSPIKNIQTNYTLQDKSNKKDKVTLLIRNFPAQNYQSIN